MLKPYVVAACERVLIDQQSNGVASLISLFNKISGAVPANTAIPPNSVVPKEWSVFSLWDTEPGDEHKNYTLCTQVLYPDRTQFADVGKLRLNIEPNKRTQAIMRFLGFPVGQLGFYTVRTWIEEENKIVVDPIEFKLEVELTSLPESPTAISSTT
jgi:hypothetical protein